MTRNTLRKRAGLIVIAGASPARGRFAPTRALVQNRQHPNGREPGLSRVVPEITILPIKALIAGVVDVVAVEADESFGRRERLAGLQRLLVAGNAILGNDRTVSGLAERTRPNGENSPNR